MAPDRSQDQKSVIYIFGGFPKHRDEVDKTLKSFYGLKFFDDLERAGQHHEKLDGSGYPHGI